MMSVQTFFNCGLISVGAIIILFSIIRSKGLLVALPFVPESQRNHVTRYLLLHRTLMMFFLFGYLVVLVGFVFDYSFVSETSVSLIFFSGAIFVYIGIVVQSRLLSEMQRTLQGILPICCKCKKIRFDDANPYDPKTWKGIEEYISEKTEVDFTHGYCPECFEMEKNNFLEELDKA